MQGTVFPRPHKWALDKKGQRYKAPLRPHEVATDVDGTPLLDGKGEPIKAGPAGSTWTWQLTTGTKKRGDRKTHGKGGYRIKGDAQAALTETLAALGKGDKRPLMKRSVDTVGEHLDGWLAACQVRQRRPLKESTASAYRTAIKAWIKPHIGKILLADLDRDHLVGLYRTLRTRGARGGKPLGDRSVQLVHTVLTKSLASAVTGDKIPASPVDRIPDDDRPTHKAEKLDDRHWTPDEAAAFLVHTRDDRLHAVDALALDTGARRGELAGLRWEYLDLDAGTMTVRLTRGLVDGKPIEGTPKTKQSRRTIRLHPATVAVLKAWRKAQLAERLAAGAAWGVPDGVSNPDECEQAREATRELSGYVFTDELGRPYCVELSKRFEQVQEGFTARRLTFHGLRHTSATTALVKLVPVHVVSARLGHSKVSITYDVYAHVIPGQDDDAAAAIGDALWGIAATGS